MHRAQWRITSRSWRRQGLTAEVVEADASVLRLQVIGTMGGLAETPHGAFSFRVGGVDPLKRGLRARLSHDVDVFDMGTRERVATFAVSPRRGRLTLAGGSVLAWTSSFLGGRRSWTADRDTLVTITLPMLRGGGEVVSLDTVPAGERALLSLLGLFLMLSGRG